MSSDFHLGEYSFSVERNEGSLPLLRPQRETPVPLGLLKEHRHALLDLIESTKSEGLWVVSPPGFQGIPPRGSGMAANPRTNNNTVLHTHPGSLLDLTAALQSSCTRLPMQFFNSDTVWNFFVKHWEVIRSVMRRVHSFPGLSQIDPSSAAELERFWLFTSNWFLDYEEIPEKRAGFFDLRDWQTCFSLFLACLPYSDDPEAQALFAAEQALQADATVNWSLPQSPSLVLIHGFHRGGVQPLDEKAVVHHWELLSGPLPR